MKQNLKKIWKYPKKYFNKLLGVHGTQILVKIYNSQTIHDFISYM